MTISPLTIYFWGIADGIQGALAVLSLSFLCLAAFCAGGWLDDHPASEEKMPAIIKRWFITGLILAFVWVLSPSSKTVAAMVIVPRIANSEALRRDVPELYAMAVDKLKESLKPQGVEASK